MDESLELAEPDHADADEAAKAAARLLIAIYQSRHRTRPADSSMSEVVIEAIEQTKLPA